MAERLWTIGFTGTALDDVVRWTQDRVENDKVFAFPFAASGKEIATFARKDRTFHTFDQQPLTGFIMNDVFKATKVIHNIDEVKFTKGFVYHERPFSNIDDHSAALIDYISMEASDLERVALFTAIMRGTYMGRGTAWGRSITVDDVWKVFNNKRTYIDEYINRPGKIIHKVGDFFKVPQEELPVDIDLLYIDPPKLVGTNDIYFKTFANINKAIGAPSDITFQKWVRKDYLIYMRRVLTAFPSKRIVFTYLSDTNPTLEEIKSLLSEFGEIVEVESFEHGKRWDYAVMVEC